MSIVTNITQFMVAVVYIELASQMIEALLKVNRENLANREGER